MGDRDSLEVNWENDWPVVFPLLLLRMVPMAMPGPRHTNIKYQPVTVCYRQLLMVLDICWQHLSKAFSPQAMRQGALIRTTVGARCQRRPICQVPEKEYQAVETLEGIPGGAKKGGKVLERKRAR